MSPHLHRNTCTYVKTEIMTVHVSCREFMPLKRIGIDHTTAKNNHDWEQEWRVQNREQHMHGNDGSNNDDAR